MPVVPSITLCKRAQPSDNRTHEDLTQGDLVKYVLQRHETARKPGRPHLDLRLGTPRTGLFSWAIPKGSLPGVRQKYLAPQSTVHDYGYGDFTGTVGRGRTRGNVTMDDKGQARITRVSPNTLNFTLAHTKDKRRFSLVRLNPDKQTGKQPKWLIIGLPLEDSKAPSIVTAPDDEQIPEAIVKAGEGPRYAVVHVGGKKVQYALPDRQRKEAQWQMPEFSSDHVQVLGDDPRQQEDLRAIRNAYWARRMQHAPIRPLEIREQAVPQLDKDFHLRIRGGDGKEHTVNLSQLQRSIDSIGDGTATIPALLSDKARTRVKGVKDLYSKITGKM